MSGTPIRTAELLALHAALRQLQADDTPQPWRLAYAAARNLRLLEGVAAAFDAARLALIQEHGRRDADGQLVADGPNIVLADPEAFAAGFHALQEQQETVALRKVPAGEMPAAMPVGIAAALLPMIDDGDREI
jgi:hypothetical protein